MDGLVADRRLYLTADKQTVVEHGDPEAAFLLAAPGQTIPGPEVARLGLELKEGQVVQKRSKAPVEDKAVHHPGEDKEPAGQPPEPVPQEPAAQEPDAAPAPDTKKGKK